MRAGGSSCGDDIPDDLRIITLDEALTETAERLDENTTDHDLPKLVLALAMRSYADALACRRVLAIMAEREGKSELLEKGKKK